MMIETAAETDELAAVVSEGAGARSTAEDLDHDDPALGKWTFGLAMSVVQVRGGGGVLEPRAAREPQGPRREASSSRCC